MNEKRALLPDNRYTTDYGSNINGDVTERVYTPEYTSINANEPSNYDDEDVSFSSPATRVATPKFDDSLLAPIPKVIEEIEVRTKLYKRRWYILVIFSLVAFTQNAVWNTWGPISASSEDAFGWDDATISLLTNWGPISYIVGALFFSWLIDRKGLRWGVVLSIALTAVGCGIRCISSTPPLVTWINNIACALNGLGGPVAMFGPPVISTTWFGPHERTTSTALSIVISGLGLAVTFIMGPFLVPDRLNPNCTQAMENLSSLYMEYEDFTGDDCVKYFNNSGVRIAQERKDIMFMLYIVCGWAVLILLLVLVYFPSKPPLPPSVSASQKRENFVVGLKTLFSRGQFWLITLIYGLPYGVADCWSGMVDVIVKPYGVTEIQAGWMGFYANISQQILSLIVARFADVFSRHFKIFIFGMYLIATVAFLCFGLICVGVLPFSIALLYTAYITAVAFLYGAVPLIYELAGELTYPIAEATTESVLTLVNNIVGFVFLFIPLIPHIGTAWMNWAMFGVIAVCLPVVLLLKESYHRLELDEHAKTKFTQEY